MVKSVQIELGVEDWVLADLEAAVAAGEAASVAGLAATILTEAAMARRVGEPTYRRWAWSKIEESLRDPHPGHPMDDVFAEARALYSEPESKAS